MKTTFFKKNYNFYFLPPKQFNQHGLNKVFGRVETEHFRSIRILEYHMAKNIKIFSLIEDF